jgi:hydroxymethylbilane synthase
VRRRSHLPPDLRLRFPEQGARRGDGQGLGRGFFLLGVFRRELRRMRPLMGRGIRIGTRGSPLALWQANWVRQAVARLAPHPAPELVVIKTRGDKILDVPLAQVGGKGLFVKEIEEALLAGAVDLAVHSMKDMPAEIPPGLTVGPVPRREDPRDALISRDGRPLSELPDGARVGTSSLRRAAQLKRLRPDLAIVPLRGNLETRLGKLHSQELEAIVLAAAGLRRMGLEGRISELLDPRRFLPAVAQGALCIEIRREDAELAALLAPLDDPPSRWAVTAERAFLRRLEGGCQVPIAAHGEVHGERIALRGLVAELDGSRVLQAEGQAPAERAAEAGLELAERLLASGGREILERLQPMLAADGQAGRRP